MPNWKYLGIEKEASEMFSEFEKTDLQLLMESSYFEHPMLTNRKKDAEYCIIEITDCQDEGWWYSKLIGFQFFVRIEWRTFASNKVVSDFKGVRLLKNKEIVFRSIDPKDAIII